MLKFVFNFRTRGVRLFCVAGTARPNVISGKLHELFLPVQQSVYDYVWVLRLHSDISRHRKYVDHGGIGDT